jgi:hypothetical protein
MTRTLKVILYIGLVICYGLIFPLSFLPIFEQVFVMQVLRQYCVTKVTGVVTSGLYS